MQASALNLGIFWVRPHRLVTALSDSAGLRRSGPKYHLRWLSAGHSGVPHPEQGQTKAPEGKGAEVSRWWGGQGGRGTFLQASPCRGAGLPWLNISTPPAHRSSQGRGRTLLQGRVFLSQLILSQATFPERRASDTESDLQSDQFKTAAGPLFRLQDGQGRIEDFEDFAIALA